MNRMNTDGEKGSLSEPVFDGRRAKWRRPPPTVGEAGDATVSVVTGDELDAAVTGY